MNMTNKFALIIILFLLTVTPLYYLNHSVNKVNTKEYNITKISIKQAGIINQKIIEVHQNRLSQRNYDILLDDQTKVSFPYPNLTFEASKMLRSQWVVNMKRKLDEAKLSKQLTLLLVNYEYFSTLLNWMAHAKLHTAPLLKDLFVVCLDEKSHIALTNKGVFSVVVKSSDLVKDTSKAFGSVVIVRLAVLRLLIYWGFDVYQLDIDALPMHNIQPIFDHFSNADIVTSIVEFASCVPAIAYKTWKFCICVGMFLMRSNPNTGMLILCNCNAIQHVC